MLLGFVAQHEFRACHPCFEIVTRMFEIGAHGKVFRCLRLVEPVLSLNVVTFLFAGEEGTADERERGQAAQPPGERERPEVGEETVFLLPVEVDAEALHVFQRAERRLAVLRYEVVVVVGDVAYQVHLPQLRRLVVQISLVVEKVGPVFPVLLQAPQQIAVGLVAQAVEPREPFCGHPHVGIGPHHACRQRGLEGRLAPCGRLQLLVVDGQCR